MSTSKEIYATDGWRNGSVQVGRALSWLFAGEFAFQGIPVIDRKLLALRIEISTRWSRNVSMVWIARGTLRPSSENVVERSRLAPGIVKLHNRSPCRVSLLLATPASKAYRICDRWNGRQGEWQSFAVILLDSLSLLQLSFSMSLTNGYESDSH